MNGQDREMPKKIQQVANRCLSCILLMAALAALRS
jgi:hypothetical protein